MKPKTEYGIVIARVALSLVLLWFGLNQIFNTSAWFAWLPSWTNSLPVSPAVLILFNGFLEVVLGVLLILGLFTRIVSLVAAIHLLTIVFSLGYNDVAVRDSGLMLVALSVFFTGPDFKSLDVKPFGQKVKLSKLGKLLYFFD